VTEAVNETETAQQKLNLAPHSAIQEKRHTISTPKKLQNISTSIHETTVLLAEVAAL
jgi:hypothetical protein